MLSQLDNIIFPDRCDVLEIVPSQRFVYPIYKNGSTSLYNSGFRLVNNDELKNIALIDIYVRDPYQRFYSGVNSFIQYHSNLDQDTILYFIKNYLFLDRHFCPQIYWLINLKRFTDAKVRINPIENLSEIITLENNKRSKSIPIDAVNFEKLHFYLTIDKVLTQDLLGKTVSLKNILQIVQYRYPDVYQEVIQRSINLCNVLV